MRSGCKLIAVRLQHAVEPNDEKYEQDVFGCIQAALSHRTNLTYDEALAIIDTEAWFELCSEMRLGSPMNDIPLNPWRITSTGAWTVAHAAAYTPKEPRPRGQNRSPNRPSYRPAGLGEKCLKTSVATALLSGPGHGKWTHLEV